MNKPSFYDLDKTALDDFVQEHAWPRFRAAQLFEWQKHGILSFDEMQNISKAMRAELANALVANPLTLIDWQTSTEDATQKALFQLPDGQMIETVAMRYGEHLSICVSSQVGCRMGCTFCASTGAGFVRNLTVGELYAQVVTMQAKAAHRVSHVTVMGIGEPLENLPNLLAFIDRLADPAGLGISMRRITVSTCGLTGQMLELANAGRPINLAVSLHAPNQKLRESLMPIARRYDLATLMEACRRYTEITHRRLTFEYALFNEINDDVQDANDLADLLHGILCHVNLIPANHVPGTPYEKSPPERVQAFKAQLERRRIVVSVRRELGSDITAACGQLRRKRESWITP